MGFERIIPLKGEVMIISTEHVLQRYMSKAVAWDQTQGEAVEEFDRWLTLVKADAWDECFNTEREPSDPPLNPYRGQSA